MQIYVQGTKAGINGALNQGMRVIGTEYTIDGEYCRELDDNLPNGTVVKFFKKRVGGTPVASAYGTWSSAKKRVL